MSKHVVKIPVTGIERIALIQGRGRSLDQVKGNAAYIINGGFYSMLTGRPEGHLKISGEVLSTEGWTSWGYAWGGGRDLQMAPLPYKGKSNYISGVPLLTPWDGIDAPLTYPAEVGGYRPRTAMAMTEDALILFCADSPMTPELLRQELYNMGAVTALMLDSGGSSQCDFQGKTVYSDRRVHNYIAVWLNKSNEPPISEEGSEESGEKVKKVVLDPGHGVETAGKCAPDKSYFEHEFNLDMARRLKPQLERHGVAVTLTRSGDHDVKLADRVKISNDIEPDLFVSLHSNASGDGSGWTDPDGYGIYTSSAGDTAGRNIAARAIIARAKEAGLKLWDDGLFHERHYVLKNTVAPAVLIEHGFHTNINEVQLLKTDVYRDLLARVDAKGILDYLGIPWQEKAAEKPAEGEKAVYITCPCCGEKLKIEKA